MEAGRIVSVLSPQERVELEGHVIDLNGYLITPSLIDAHTHMFLTADLLTEGVYELELLKTSHAARREVRIRVAQGVARIKVFADWRCADAATCTAEVRPTFTLPGPRHGLRSDESGDFLPLDAVENGWNYHRMNGTQDVLVDRVFILVWGGRDIARLRSRGSTEMFWETFSVEPLSDDASLVAKLFDPSAWNEVEFLLRHERTGATLASVFSAGGRPPARADPTGPLLISVRGTSTFAPPATEASWLRRIVKRLRS